jgi:NAD(P)H dehydrogenase (quinone)
MPKNVLIILGHPAQTSFGQSIAQRYQTEAQSVGHSVQTIELERLQFDPILHLGYKGEQALEPDLVQAQSQMKWADEIVLVFPIWWGGMPALLKGFLDRTLLPGFAFKYEPAGKGLEALLKGRTARVIMTMDTPRWIDRWLYGSPCHPSTADAHPAVLRNQIDAHPVPGTGHQVYRSGTSSMARQGRSTG